MIESEANKQAEYALELCRFLHRNPELSLQETETAKRMAKELRDIEFEVTESFGGNSVVGVLKNGEGPVVLLRTDMDALPVQEKTDLDFASTKTSINEEGEKVPVMHACGHDIHMAAWVGSLRVLAAKRSEWKGTIVALAQQAEEINNGAGEAIEAGLFKQFPVPGCALAFHINPELESGRIALVEGPVFAGVKSMTIKVFGKGGHGAYPEKCIDPVVIASQIILNIQTIVSRRISPLEPVVVTVGSIHGGSRPNIIPDEVEMELTLRYYSDNAIEKVITAITDICNSAASAAGMNADMFPEVVVSPVGSPPVLNDYKLTKSIRKLNSEMLGKDGIAELKPAMVGEDFGKFGRTKERIPLCLIWLGSTSKNEMENLKAEGKFPHPLHSPFLNPDYKATIETGIKVMANSIVGLLNGTGT